MSSTAYGVSSPVALSRYAWCAMAPSRRVTLYYSLFTRLVCINSATYPYVLRHDGSGVRHLRNMQTRLENTRA
jgi:hypothetical protein